MFLQKLQAHTIQIYKLASQPYQIKTVKARSLLTSKRFDLFAKLFYIGNIKHNRNEALSVYNEHIKIFNPDLKEPGRKDKNCLNDFQNGFDNIIEQFSNFEFSADLSLIPVDTNGVILDGAHRIASLAYYDKNVTIIQFKNVVAKCDFDYMYFKIRGLSWNILDTIAHEMTKWLPNLLVACVWPRANLLKNRKFVLDYLSVKNRIAYIKEFHISLTSLINFVALIYKEQDWTMNLNSVTDKAINCYSNSKRLTLIFFETESNLENIIYEKSIIRQKLHCENHSIHITDNTEETIAISTLINTKSGINSWYKTNRFAEKFKEQFYYLKNVHWLNFKIFIYKLCKRND